MSDGLRLIPWVRVHHALNEEDATRLESDINKWDAAVPKSIHPKSTKASTNRAFPNPHFPNLASDEEEVAA